MNFEEGKEWDVDGDIIGFGGWAGHVSVSEVVRFKLAINITDLESDKKMEGNARQIKRNPSLSAQCQVGVMAYWRVKCQPVVYFE